jgi:hypothetical protein
VTKVSVPLHLAKASTKGLYRGVAVPASLYSWSVEAENAKDGKQRERERTKPRINLIIHLEKLKF